MLPLNMEKAARECYSHPNKKKVLTFLIPIKKATKETEFQRDKPFQGEKDT